MTRSVAQSVERRHGALDRPSGAGDGGLFGHRGCSGAGPGTARTHRRRPGQEETQG